MGTKTIYALINRENGLFYVGQTRNLKGRLKMHRGVRPAQAHLLVKRAFAEFGFDSFAAEVLAEVEASEAFNAEAVWMEHLAQQHPDWRCLNEVRPMKAASEKVKKIRAVCETGLLTQKQIAAAFNTSQSMVSRINNGIVVAL